MTSGRVMPWPTSVTRVTVNVITMSASLAGKAAPLGSAGGIASAAASDTTPRIPAHEANVGTHDARRPPAEIQPRGNGREYPGDPERLRGKVRGVRREQRNGDLDRHVLEARPDLRHDPSHGEADQDPPDGDHDEV